MPSRLAVQSPACENLGADEAEIRRWNAARDRCWTRGYNGAHVYLSLVDGQADAMRNMARADPWMNDLVTRDRVHVIVARSFEEARRELRRIVESCQIIQYLFVDTHASPGELGAPEGGDQSVLTFVERTLSPCSLAPRARIQFSGCNLACGSYGEEIAWALTSVFDSRSYAPDRNPEPFAGIRMQMNTSIGLVFPGLRLGPLGIFDPTSNSENERPLELRVSGDGRVRSTMSASEAPDCSAEALGF